MTSAHPSSHTKTYLMLVLLQQSTSAFFLDSAPKACQPMLTEHYMLLEQKKQFMRLPWKWVGGRAQLSDNLN